MFSIKFDTTMPYVVTIAQLMIFKSVGDNIAIFATRPAVSDIQLILIFRDE